MAFAQAKDSLLLHGYQSGVVKSGVMYYKSPRIRLQPTTWPTGCVKYWCELHRESSYHPRELVLAEMPKDIHEDVEIIPLETISLETVFKITRKEELIKEKSIFQIMTSNGKYTLGTDSLEKTKGWIRVLNEELFGPPKHNVVYEYRVKVQKTYSEDIYYGSYLLKVYNNEIKLYTPNGLIPTKFKCLIKDIHKVKYHAFGQLKSCVTISIKNAQTNNEEVDVVILNANSALEMERVISHRKKILLSKDKSGGAIATQDHDPCVPINLLQECFNEVKQNLRGINITSTSNEAFSKPSLRRQKKLQHDDAFVEEEGLNSDDGDATFTLLESSKEDPILSQSLHSLPRIYRVTTDPSVDDHDGEVWSESFELRAPKRKQGIRMKKHLPIPPHRATRNRPPAALPGDVETSFEDQHDNVAIDSNTSPPTDSQSSTEYDYIKPNTIPRLKDANAILTQAGESYSDDYEEDYVITSISHNQTYLRVLSPEEKSISALKPADDAFK